MTSTRLCPLLTVIILATSLAGACAKNNNAQLAELQVELRAERELLKETRAELQAVMTRLEPLLEVMELAKASTLRQEFDTPPILPAPMPTEDAAGIATEKAASDGIAKTGKAHYQISRTRFEELLGNPTEMARGARIVPSMKDGQADGFKLFAIRPSSVFAHLGLQNGDTLHRFNGVELNSPETALEVYSKLRTATRIDLELTRRGQPITLSYTIR